MLKASLDEAMTKVMQVASQIETRIAELEGKEKHIDQVQAEMKKPLKQQSLKW